MGRAEAGTYTYIVRVPGELVTEAKNLLTKAEKLATIPIFGVDDIIAVFDREFDAAAFTQILRENTGRLIPYAKASNNG